MQVDIEKIRELLSRYPAHYTVPALLLVVVILVATVAAVFRAGPHPADVPRKPVQAQTSAPALTDSAAAVPLSVAAGRVPAASSTVARPVPAPVAEQPPAGVAAGWIARTTHSPDQFGKMVQTGDTVVRYVDSSGVVTAGLTSGQPARVVRYDGWINTSAETSAASLQVAGGDAEVAAKIDGWRLAEIRHSHYSGPDDTQSTLSLAAGWHRLEIELHQKPNVFGGRADDVSTRIAIGTADAFAVPTVYSVPPASSPAASSTVVAAASSVVAPAAGSVSAGPGRAP